MVEIKFAPKEVFETALKWFVMPTFDLIIEYQGGVIMAKRKIAPYKNQWALPGLRMYKGEEIGDTLKRIAEQELGLKIDPRKAKLVGQYVGKFHTEKARQDLSTSYAVAVSDDQEVQLNEEHFFSFKIVKTIPPDTGAMYRYYLRLWGMKD